MATPTPPEELDQPADDELLLLAPARPRFARSWSAKWLPNRMAKLGGGTSVSRSAKEISCGVWIDGSSPAPTISSRRSSNSFLRRTRRRRRVTNRRMRERLRMARCLLVWRCALRAALRRFRVFSGITGATSVPQLVFPASRATTADAAEMAGAGAAAGGCLGGRDAGRVEPRWLLLAFEHPTGG